MGPSDPPSTPAPPPAAAHPAPQMPRVVAAHPPSQMSTDPHFHRHPLRRHRPRTAAPLPSPALACASSPDSPLRSRPPRYRPRAGAACLPSAPAWPSSSPSSLARFLAGLGSPAAGPGSPPARLRVCSGRTCVRPAPDRALPIARCQRLLRHPSVHRHRHHLDPAARHHGAAGKCHRLAATRRSRAACRAAPSGAI